MAAVVAVLVLLSGFAILLTTSAQSNSSPDAPTGLSAEAGDTQVRLSWEDPTDSTIDKYQLWQIAESATLTEGTNDAFGYSVAVVGDIAVVGMPDEEDSSDDSGAAFVFSKVNGAWTQKYRLRTGDDAGVVKDDGFGRSIAFDGNTVVVGAPFDNGKRGTAYLFVEPNDGWDNQSGTDTVDLTDPAKLTAPNASVEDEFGDSVAVDGNTVVVGAYSDDSTDTVDDSGSAYVFTEPGTGWVSTSTAATLTASDAAAGDYFGDSVAVHEGTIVIGASGDDGSGSETEATDFMGSAFVFVKPTNGGWVTTSTAAKLIAETRGNQDNFGRSVAVDGDTILVGADGQDTNAGSAFVFVKPASGGWVSTSTAAKLTAAVRNSNDRFGFSVALDGDTVVVGAYGEAGSRGSAYAFTKPGTGWASGTETAHLTASDRNGNDRFGSSVAIDGDTVVIGVENDDTAYVFDIVDWEDIADSDATTTFHIVTGLTNKFDHTFRVRAVDGGETSDPSDSVAGTPKVATYVPVKLLNFSAAQTGDGEVELTWDAHRYPLTVTGYEYKQDSGDWTAITGSDFGTHSYTVTGLTQGVTYGFRVRAVNGAGSTESDSRSVTIIGQSAAPDSFTAVAGDEQVWLGWRNPADFTISGYEYQQKTGVDFGDDWTSIPGSRSGTTFHIVTGLTNDTSYTFRVRAVNAAGGSDASVEQSATPVATSSAPVKPEGFSARQAGIGRVELTWEASSNPLNVTGYQFKQNSGSWTAISESDHSTVSHIITGLTQGVTYIFRVRAVNSAGSTESDSQPVIVVAEPSAPTELGAETGDTQVGLTWKDPGNASIAKYQIFQFPESVIKLISSDHDGGDELGFSVAVDDDTLVIGALGDDDDSPNVGAAYVFTRVAGGWTQAGKLTASDRKDDAGFGHAVAVHGDTIVVGAYEEDHPDPDDALVDIDDVGAAYVFTRPATGWADMIQTARLTASDAASNDEFGNSVAVHEDTIVVGAPEQGPDGDGSAYIFTKPANGWADMTETAALKGELISKGDRFGRSVAVHGDTVVVGAFEENGNRGAVYVFTEPGGGWTSTSTAAKLTASDRASGDRFGRAVAMDGDTIVIGAPYHDYDDPDNNTNDVSNSGAAYVFIKTATGGWATDIETAKLTASERGENDQFGFSVAVDGNTVVVGADQDDNNRGSAHVFTEPQGGWTDTEGTDPLTAYGRSQNGRFGNFVAVDGDTVLVGAVGEDSAKGSAYVFGTGEWADIPGSGAETISHIARGLLNNVKHTFRVRAVNAAGAGDASEADAKAVAATFLPSRPADLNVTQTGVGQVRLAWPASTEPLTVRRYQYKQDDGGGFGDWISIEGSDSSTASHTITGLIAGIEYSFTVGAVNGGGQDASEVESVTLEALPQAPSGLDAVAGDEQVKLSWDDPDDSTIDKYQLWQLAERLKLEASGTPDTRAFGNSLAIDGDTAVVGARADEASVGDPSVGAAYVFTRDPDSNLWKQVAKLTTSDGASNDNFGISVAVHDETIVVGAHLDDGTDSGGNAITDSGSAYVFTKPIDGWADATETAKLTASDGGAGDEFGYSVAVHDETIVVGAYKADGTDSGGNAIADSGSAYIFTKPYIGWRNTDVSAKLTLNPSTASGEFGHSVAVLGDTVMIGATGVKLIESGSNYVGAVYVFARPETGWADADTGSKPRLAASDGEGSDTFGWSVAMDGDTVVIGAHGDKTSIDGNDVKTGSAYVFIEPDTGWATSTETIKLLATDGALNDEFGESVAVDGDTIVVGAHGHDANAVSNAGAAYVFTKPINGWDSDTEDSITEAVKVIASDGAEDDLFGFSVAVDGDSLLVGAHRDDGIAADGVTNISNAGIVYVFGNPEEWTDIPDSAAVTTSHIVTGLTNDLEHSFRVRGANAAGVGFASASAGGTPTFAIPNRPTGFTADAGDTAVDLSWDDPEDSTIEKYQMLQITQGGKLTAASTDDPVVRGDGFGISVAADGDTAVVGAYQDDDDGANSGSVHVFTRSSSTAPWSWRAKLTADDAAAGDEFGIAVAVDGDTIVVGAHQNDSSKGAAYVFTWNSSNSKWEQKAKLTASDAATNYEFGISVAVDGGTVVVGTHKADYIDLNDSSNNLADSGAAYVFTKPESGGWADATETAKLTASDAAANDQFGISVAVHGETVVVGAHQNDADDQDNNEGAAYVFTKPEIGGWADATETAKLTAADGAENDEFGISVAMHDDTIVVGAHQDDDATNGSDSGSTYVFIKPETDANDDDSEDWKDWGSLDDDAKAALTAKLTAADGAADDEFGISVTIDGDTLVVGAYQDDENGDNSGSAYVFTRDSNGWSQKTKLTGPSRGREDWLGYSVAVAGYTVLAGAYQSNISGPDSGAVYLWTVPGWADINGSGPTTAFNTITGLTNQVEYSFQVRAVDKVEGAGASPPTDPLRATPLKPRPAEPTGLTAVAGDSQVLLSWNDPAGGSPPINSYQLWQHAERTMLTADIRETSDEFGYAVAIDGDTAVVGMPGEDNPLNSGAAFVFTRDSSGTWSRVARLRASDPVDDDGDDDNDQHKFGLSVAVHEDTLNGDTIVVGAPDHSNSKGAVYVFSEPSDGWANDIDSDDVGDEFDHTTETAKLLASDGEADDEFGISVAVDGDTIVVGAYQNDADTNDNDEGAAYVFTKGTDDDWANDQNEDHTTQTLKLSWSGSSDNFGRSVAIDGDTIVVGASGVDSGSGSVFVFIEPDTGWANSPGTEVAELTAYDRSGGDRFGRSVAIDGKTIVVGAYGDDSNKGSAHVFIEPDAGWANSPGTETAKLTASDRADNDQFGRSVSVDDDTVVVGAHQHNIGGVTDVEGSAYVFTKPNAVWVDSSETAKLPGPGDSADDQFGWSVAIDDDTILVGADWQDSNDQGAAYVYDFQVWAPITGGTGETSSHFATGLTNGLEHNFAVRAVNDGGASGPSNQASAQPVAEATPPAKPRNFSAVQVANGAVRLEWELSADPLTIVTFKYTADGGSNWPKAVGSHSNTVSYTVSDLTVDTTYTFAVRAVNSAGDGDSSDLREVTIVAAPAAPTGLRADPGNEQVELSWSYSGGQTSITGFQYQQKTGDDFGDDWTDVTGSTWGTRSHIVTGLTNGIEHAFRVRAVNVTIASAPSNTVTSIIPEAAGSRPASPENFNAEQTGVGQVELRWDTAEARLTVTGYQYTADGGSSWTDISGSDSGTVSYTVSDLTVGTTYTFAVRAVNSDTFPGFSSSFRDVTIVDAPRRPTGLGATGGDTQATFHWNVMPVTTNRPIEKYQLLHLPQSKLTDDDGADNDGFGISVAADGDTAVVGAYQDDDDGANSGSVHVFTRSSSTAPWSWRAKLTADDAAAGDEFGIAVAVDGDTIVVGAHQNDSSKGAAYVFTWNSSNSKWEQKAKLTASDAATNYEFGISVAVDGGTVVVGTHKADYIDLNDSSNNLADSGAAYVFTKPESGGWADATETAKLTASDAAANDQFGISVSVDGDTIVVGAHLHDIDDDGTSIPNAGAVYVFTRPAGGGWAVNTKGAKFTAPDGAANDEFGISVAIDVDAVVVGAHLHDVGANANAGAAYVFTRDSNSGKWGQPLKLTASNGHADDGFGNSVAVDGTIAVVGAYLDDRDAAARDTGSTYVFARKLGVWSQTLNLAGPGPELDDWLGYSVAVDDGTLLAGAPQDDNDPGFAYAMDISNAEWTDFVSTELTDNGEVYFYRVLNLTNDQEYAFRVRSVNSVANRPSDETVAATPMLAKPGRTEGLSAKAGDRRVTLSWDDPRDSSLTGYQVLRPPEQIKLTAGSDGETEGEFGESVAVDDGTAVVGAPEHDGTDSGGTGITDAGASYVFTRNPNSGAWSDPIELTAGSDGAENDWFGYSVAVDGDTIVVGAHKADYIDLNDSSNNLADSGAAYVFTRDSTGEWRAPIKLIASDGAENDWFGYSVAVHEGVIVVGAREHNGKAGAAYVFTRDSDTGAWGEPAALGETHRTQTAKLTASGGAGFDYFGQSVAVHGNTIVVGAHQHDVTEEQDNIGAAYVFTKSGAWANNSAQVELTATDADTGAQFGYSVAVDGDTVVVGARQDDSKKGLAYVFTKPGDSWEDWDPTKDTETAKLGASDGAGSDYFGASVAVRDSTIVVGAYEANIVGAEDGDDLRSGAAYLFTKPSSGWANDPNQDHRTESRKLTLRIKEGVVEKSDEFGNSVALDGQSIVVGAPQDDDGFGSAYVSDIPMWADISGSKATTTSLVVRRLPNGVEYAFQVRAVDDTGEGSPSDIVRATPMPAPEAPNRPPYFIGGDVTFSIDERTPPGTLVGSAGNATDPNGDTLTYSLSGAHASFFSIDIYTGQIYVGSDTQIDYESDPMAYTVIVSVRDGKSPYNNPDTSIDDYIVVNIAITNIDEAGTVVVLPEQPEVGTALMASLTDPDGSLSDTSWQWARSVDGSNWSDIAGADSDTYTPVADDAGSYLRAMVSYTDGHGPSKSAYAVSGQRTTQRDPSFEGDVIFTVDEGRPPGSPVGDAVTATDPEGDVLTYSLSGTDASSFVLDGSTGEITVGSGTLLDYESGPTRYTVVVSVHDGRGAYGNDDTAVDDLIEVSIDVSNVDEAGTVSVSPEQPEVGTALVVSLSDPDGLVSNISWQWARSSDGSDWSDISGANSDSYTPVADDVGIYLQATASYTDGHGPGKSAHAVMERQTAQRGPSFEGDVTLTVDENTPPGSLVGDAVTATDPDGDMLTYSLSGTDASSFVLDGSTGEITVGSGTLLDYESGPTRYTVVVSVHDGRGAYGNDDTAVDDLIEVSIDVSNVDEAGTVSVSLEQPEVGTALVVSLSDPDGSLSDIFWQWARSSDRSDWQDMAGASSFTYTPVDLDADKYLRVTSSYADGEGSGKQAQAVLNNPVQGLPEPVATPTITATDTPAPEPTPTPTLTALTPTAESEPSEADGGDGGFPWWVIVAVVIGVIAGVALIIGVLRSRR